MLINIKKYLTGAKEARGLTVVLDIFRASNTIIACLDRGADYIIPVAAINQAWEIKKKHLDHLLFGERGGITVEGFDHGNSPAEVSAMDLSGAKIILTTSAGSQGIVNASQAEEIIIGSFANAEAVVSYIAGRQPQEVTLLAIGENADTPATEDELCAEYIQAKLENKEIDFEQTKDRIITSVGADRLRRFNQDHDLAFALKLNTHKLVPKFKRSLWRIEK